MIHFCEQKESVSENTNCQRFPKISITRLIKMTAQRFGRFFMEVSITRTVVTTLTPFLSSLFLFPLLAQRESCINTSVLVSLQQRQEYKKLLVKCFDILRSKELSKYKILFLFFLERTGVFQLFLPLPGSH